MAEYTLTTPSGFFSSTIEPVFNEDIFSEANLSEEIQKPDLTPITTIRQQIDAAANDSDISTTEFDAAADLARQKLLSDITSQDSYTRGKRDLEFNISAERDVQFQQGQQLLRDIDAYVTASRATVVQREYEEQLKKEEEALEDQKKEELQLMAMKLGIDPNGLSRKDLRTFISKEIAKQYKDTLTTSRGGSGGSDDCGTGYYYNAILGSCMPTASQQSTNDLASKIKQQLISENPNLKGDELAKRIRDVAASQYNQDATGPGSYMYNASMWASDLTNKISGDSGSFDAAKCAETGRPEDCGF